MAGFTEEDLKRLGIPVPQAPKAQAPKLDADTIKKLGIPVVGGGDAPSPVEPAAPAGP